MKCDFDTTLTNSLCKDMNSSKILNHWLYFYSLYIKRLVGREGWGEQFLYIHRKKNAVSDCFGLVFNEYIFAYVHNVCYMTVDTCVIFFK